MPSIYQAVHGSSREMFSSKKKFYCNVGYTQHSVEEERLKDKDYKSKNPGTETWEMPYKFKRYDLTKSFEDKVHKLLSKEPNVVWLKNNHLTKNNNQEQFEFDFSFETNITYEQAVKKAEIIITTVINSIYYGKSKLNNYSERKEQKDTIKKVNDFFNKLKSDLKKDGAHKIFRRKFLIDAKMRFGKCFTCYKIAKEIDAKKILIITHFPKVLSSWKNDLNHVDFDYQFNEAKNGYNGDGVYFVSAQKVMADERNENDSVEWIYDNDWDLVIYDEEHYGSKSENAQKIISKLENKSAFFIYLSGTAFKSLLSGEFDDDQIFSWTYEDEYKAKKSWQGPDNPYLSLPDMKYFGIEISDFLKKKNKKVYSKEEQSSLAKIFATDDNKFIHDPLVNEFIDVIFGCSEDAKNNLSSPYFMSGVDSKIVNRSIWRLPNVAAGKLLEEKINQHLFGKKFQVINACGSDGENDPDKINEVLKAKDKVIILTVDRHLVGVTLPKLGAIFFLDDGESITEWYQACFRPQSPCPEINKNECYVFDFNPKRCVRLVYTIQSLKAIKKNQDISELTREFLDCAPIYISGLSGLKQLDATEVLKIGRENSNYCDKFSNAHYINLSNVDQTIISALDNIKVLNGSSLSIDKTINDYGLEKGKTSKKVNLSNKNNEDQINKIKEKAQEILKAIPRFCYQVEVNSCSGILQLNDKDKEIFLEETTVSVENFIYMLENNFLSEDYINNCIIDFNSFLIEINKECNYESNF